MEDEEKKYIEHVKIIVAIVITFVFTLCTTIILYYSYLSKKGLIVKKYDSSEEITTYLNEVRTQLEDQYIGEIDDETLKEYAIKGYVSGLGDQYTEYLTQSEYENLTSELSDFVGIGVYLGENKTTKETIILGTVSEDSPAEKAGMKAGDILLEVNSEDVRTKGSQYVSSKVKGEEGTSVNIKVLRGQEELSFDVTRQSIKMYKIKYEMLKNNIGYIDFDSFTDTSDQEFAQAYDELKKQGAKYLIVDLRDNSGGYVTSALNIADLFVEKGKTLLITKNSKDEISKEYAKTDKVIDIPVVVLVNNYSASASEILTGILKDYGIAKIVGTNTYGKGVMQTIISGIYKGALKITTAEYFSPNENKINQIGIKPDVEVELTDEAKEKLTRENDNQLQKAIEVVQE